MNKLKKVWAWFCETMPLVEPHTFERWVAVGTCTDGSTFTYVPPYYVRASGLTCDAPDWIAGNVKKDGFYRVGEVMYYLQNVIAVEWRRVEQLVTVIPYEQYNFKINYSPAALHEAASKAQKILQKN